MAPAVHQSASLSLWLSLCDFLAFSALVVDKVRMQTMASMTVAIPTKVTAIRRGARATDAGRREHILWWTDLLPANFSI